MKTFLLLFLATATSLAQNSLPALNQKAPELELHQGLQTPGNLIPTLASLHGRLEHFHLRYIVDSAVMEPGLGVLWCDLG